MGNTLMEKSQMDTANFVSSYGRTLAMSNYVRRRFDKVYFRPTESITLTSIGLTSAIFRDTTAYFRVLETSSEKELFSQEIELRVCHVSDEYPSHYYNLSTPLFLQEKTYYTIQIEVQGGPVHTYFEAASHLELSCLNIDLSRKMPKHERLLNKRHAMSKLLSDSNLDSPQRTREDLSTSGGTTPTFMSVDGKTVGDKKKTSGFKSYTTSIVLDTIESAPSSLTNLDAKASDSSRKLSSFKSYATSIAVSPYSSQDLNVSSSSLRQINRDQSSNDLSKSVPKSHSARQSETKLKETKEGFRMNLISGIQFETKSHSSFEIGCCGK